MSAWDAHATLARGLTLDGYARLSAAGLTDVLGAGVLEGWAGVARSWDDLPLDTFMGDGGRYRRRRHACFSLDDAGIRREPHQPHVQSRAHNPLNGGIERWFAPVDDATASNAAVHTLLMRLGHTFAVAAGVSAADARWFVEMHQFRIEASAEAAGHPTPEGLHRDGVDWVAILLVGRDNVQGGVTTITDAAGQPRARFALEAPLELIVLDDRRVRHGVSAIGPADAAAPARRDTLVVTYRDRRVL